jgi:hypothetical protein
MCRIPELMTAGHSGEQENNYYHFSFFAQNTLH